MKKFLIFLWTLPQSLLGWVMSLFCRKTTKFDKPVYIWSFKGAVSLGMFIFVKDYASEFTVAHEYGHYKQSLMLGWLYLLVIGLPSFVWATLQTIGLFKNVCYYDFYTERWANKIAGYEAWNEYNITYYEKV